MKLCEDALAAGMCPVVGIQSTGEARTAEYVAALSKKSGKGDDEHMQFDSFVEPAALILSSFIEKNLMDYPGGATGCFRHYVHSSAVACCKFSFFCGVC